MRDTKAMIKNFINTKVNNSKDKQIPFVKIPESLKAFWEEKFKELSEPEKLIYKERLK